MKIAAFIDGANLYASIKNLGFEVDYRRLLTWLETKGDFTHAFYYTAMLEGEEHNPLRPLIDWLDYNGFHVVTKTAKEFTDAAGRRKVKGNMDIEIAVDMIEAASYADHIFLFTGDGDFRRAVEAVQKKGTRVTVISTILTQPPMAADELRRQADKFIDIADIRACIENLGHQDKGKDTPAASQETLNDWRTNRRKGA